MVRLVIRWRSAGEQAEGLARWGGGSAAGYPDLPPPGYPARPRVPGAGERTAEGGARRARAWSPVVYICPYLFISGGAARGARARRARHRHRRQGPAGNEKNNKRTLYSMYLYSEGKGREVGESGELDTGREKGKGPWDVERILAVIGTGGPVKRRNVIRVNRIRTLIISCTVRVPLIIGVYNSCVPILAASEPTTVAAYPGDF
eukprot:3112657-Pyramimonas_sp.AAC.1